MSFQLRCRTRGLTSLSEETSSLMSVGGQLVDIFCIFTFKDYKSGALGQEMQFTDHSLQSFIKITSLLELRRVNSNLGAGQVKDIGDS